MIAALKSLAKRHWPALSIRAILWGSLVFVAALPGVGAVFLRVYENTLVQQTEAELVAQGAVLAAVGKSFWTADDARRAPVRIDNAVPGIDLRTMAILPPLADPVAASPPDPRLARVAAAMRPIVAEAGGVTLAAVRILDARGVVVLGRGDVGLSYAAADEVRDAIAGRATTVLRGRSDYAPRYMLEALSRASAIRVHHARPITAGGRTIGVIMLSRSPRGLFLGIYQDRGKIALGVGLILATLTLLAALLSRGIARPLTLLGQATQGVAQGTIAVPDTPATAATEIRELYANFRAMAVRIDKRSRYLRDFAAAVSHEFKTPIAGITGALELLGDHGDTMSADERARFIGNAADDADRLSRLIGRLQDLARADMTVAAGDARADVGACVAQVAAMLRSDGFAVVPVGPADAFARISPDVLQTVLETLVTNSRQAGATRVGLDVEATSSAIVIRVGDDGAGVPAGDVARVFEPFFTGRREAGGTGLGLPIARSLLAASGGDLVLLPSAKGALFVVTLSRAVSRPDASIPLPLVPAST